MFHGRVEDGTLDSVQGPAQRPDVIIETGGDAFLELSSGRLGFEDAVRDGAVTVPGDDEHVRRLHTLFRWPQPRART